MRLSTYNKIIAKMKSKLFSTCILSACVLALAFTAAAKKPHGPKPPKKEILHFFAEQQMTNLGVLPGASGKIKIHLNQQSKGKPLSIRMEFAGLETNGVYHLAALVGDATNQTDIAQFTANGEGKAKLDYRDKLSGKGSKNPVPDALRDVGNIHELSVLNATNQAILQTALSSPGKLEYLLKRDLSTNSIDASLHLKGKTSKSQMRLDVAGLEANTDYSLLLNGVSVVTQTSEADGDLKIVFEPANPLDILSLETIELQKTLDSTVVLSTNL